MLALYLLQAVIPFTLIAWLAYAPPRSAVGFWTQAFTIALSVVAIRLTGILAFPPWWSPYLFVALLSAAVLRGVTVSRRRSVWPDNLLGWSCLLVFGAVGLYGASQTRVALAARTMPPGRLIELAAPLGTGVYLVANGGAASSVNAHAAFLDQSVARRRPYWGTAHGVDLIALRRWGLRVNGILPADPSLYASFARPVIAPCAGEVMVSVDGLPDNPVPQTDPDHLAGNHIFLRCAEADILLGHFRNGSLRVSAGQRLRVGDAIAEVGNSGNSSEPHLHISAQTPGTAAAPFSGRPIPILINGQYLVRNDRVHFPQTGARL